MKPVQSTTACVYSAQRNSLTVQLVRVEIDISRGMHAFSIIGLPNKEVDEARGRLSAAIKHSGFKSPKQQNQKIVVSLAPADIKKTGTLFDLPIALTYLLANGDLRFDSEKRMFIGELSLTGVLQKAKGIIPILNYAKKQGMEEVIIPEANMSEATLISGITIIPAPSLSSVVQHLTGVQRIAPLVSAYTPPPPKQTDLFEAIKGQKSVKRALSIAGAGGHNIALYGPPGTGKTLLARSLIGVLPQLTQEECIEVTSMHSISRNIVSPIYDPPFRNPHHSSSYTSVVGGGNPIRPGEISLAHRGVLFLDEFPEFDRRVIESLREPLEEHSITIRRTGGIAVYPASCILVVAFNLCPCGNTGTDTLCTCSPHSKLSYTRKLSGPIADRIDIWVPVEASSFTELEKRATKEDMEHKEEISASIASARTQQQKRYKGSRITLNSEIDANTIEQYISLSPSVSTLLQTSAERLSLSPRGYHRVIKCARTIADMCGSEDIQEDHILEAIGYRSPPDL